MKVITVAEDGKVHTVDVGPTPLEELIARLDAEREEELVVEHGEELGRELAATLRQVADEEATRAVLGHPSDAGA